jgi:hypothetical protein
MSDRQTLRDVVDAIDRGAGDDRVVGMIAKIGAASMGMAQTQELRDAVLRFRSHKKFAVAYSETFGEFGPGNGAYYLATAFDHIYLQPSGDVGLTGIIMESPFIKGTLGKLGMTFHGDHRYEYKAALNFYTDSQVHRCAQGRDDGDYDFVVQPDEGWDLPGAADCSGEISGGGGCGALSGQRGGRGEAGGCGCLSRRGLWRREKQGGRRSGVALSR